MQKEFSPVFLSQKENVVTYIYIYCKKWVQCVSDAEVPEIISPYSLVIVNFYFLSHLFVFFGF